MALPGRINLKEDIYVGFMVRRLIAYDIITTRTSEELAELVLKYAEKGWEPHGPTRIRHHTDPVTGEEKTAYWRVVARYGERTAW